LKPGIIAKTYLWINKTSKEIVEFDMEFNTYYTWGDATVNPSVMDLRDIATHEFGHSIGLDDLYASKDWALTMYGYSSVGETIKRDLGYGDILGVQKLYGV
jgi:predicted Zn-dependent protease